MELENRKVDGLQVCLIGHNEPEAGYLCKIFHFCMEVIYPSLVLVQTRLTERLLMGRKESNQIKQEVWR